MKHVSRRTRNLSISLCLASVITVVGCESKPIALPAREVPVVSATMPTTLGPGDDVEIKFYYAPELNIQQKVRSDGKISVQLVGDIQAAGKTPEELDAMLQDAYSKHLKFPEVSVIVRGMYSRRVIVTGEVVRPGMLDMPSQLSLMEAIGIVGGFNHTTANLEQVIVSRADASGVRTGYVVNLKDEYKGAIVQPFMLQPTDIVIVPRTRVVEVNQWMRQYISNNIPGGGNVFYSQSVGSGSITASGGTSAN